MITVYYNSASITDKNILASGCHRVASREALGLWVEQMIRDHGILIITKLVVSRG